MEKHIPKRMCMACRSMLPKDELIRLVKTENGVVIDSDKKIQKRGYYLCNKRECFEIFKRKHMIEKHFKINSDIAYAKLNELIK